MENKKRKFRKLEKNEKRLRVGFEKFTIQIKKPKNFKKWKEDKIYIKSLRFWIPDREYQFSKGRYRKYERRVGIPPRRVIPKPKERIVLKRIRKQVVMNYRPSFDDTGDSIGGVGAISIRAISVQPDINERGLLEAVKEIEQTLKSEFRLRLFERRYLGFEEVEISGMEDKGLNNVNVMIEVFINKQKTIFIR